MVTAADLKDEPVPPQGEADTIGGLEVHTVEETEHYLQMLIYGEPGSGKTYLAGSASIVDEMSPVLFVDVEGGTLTLRKDFPDVKRVRINSFTDLKKIHSHLRRGDHPYKTVVVDSLTELRAYSMDVIMARASKENPNQDPEVPSVREWGKNSEQVRRIVRAFRDLEMNVIMTCLPTFDKDDAGKLRIGIDLPGKLSGHVAGFYNNVSYLHTTVRKEDVKRILTSGANDRVVAKDRSNTLPQSLVEPTMRKIYDAVILGKSVS